MNIAVQYLSDANNTLTVALYANGSTTVVAGEYDYMVKLLIILRDAIRAYNTLEELN